MLMPASSSCTNLYLVSIFYQSRALLASITVTVPHREADHHREVDQSGDYVVLMISLPIFNQMGSNFGKVL